MSNTLRSWNWVLVWSILLPRSSFPDCVAKAETLRPLPTGGTHTVQIYTVKPDQAAESRTSMAVEDIPELIWAAANALLSDDPKAPAHTLVVGGVTYLVHPGSVPTLAPVSSATTYRSIPVTTSAHLTSSASSTSAPITTTISSESGSQPSRSWMPRQDGEPSSNAGDKYIAIGVAVAFGLIGVLLMSVILCAMRRRKDNTDSLFKPSRFSISSVIGSVRGRRQTSLRPGIPPPIFEEKDRALEDVEQAAPAPSVRRNSTIRPVMDESHRGYAAFLSRRQSIERLRSRRLVSRGMWMEVRPHELEGDGQNRAELDAVSPTVRASSGRTWSFRSTDNRGPPPAARPMVVTYSMTSSSGAPGSREESREDFVQEPVEDITPVAPSMLSYRDRRPADLRLPTASNRFRDQRLRPFQFENTSSPEISPMVTAQRLSSSPQGTNGVSPTPSSNFRDRLVSSIVHCPSLSEVSGFEFIRGQSPLARRNDDDGEDGWRPGRDSVYGRYELA